MRAARKCATRVISELEFAYSRSDCPWVAVTGTNGKTTTTALLAHLLDSGGIPALAVGNIGVPAIEAVAECDSARVLVAEVFVPARADRNVPPTRCSTAQHHP